MEINISDLSMIKSKVQSLLRTPTKSNVRLSLQGILGLINHLESDIEQLNKELETSNKSLNLT